MRPLTFIILLGLAAQCANDHKLGLEVDVMGQLETLGEPRRLDIVAMAEHELLIVRRRVVRQRRHRQKQMAEALAAGIGAYADTLARMAQRAHARFISGLFLDGLLATGTTSAMVFPTVHADSVDALFEAADAALYEAKARGRDRVSLAAAIDEVERAA